MKKNRLSILVIVALILVIGLYQGTFIVNETEQVIITQFGKPVGNAITEPGVHFKVPFTQKANFFEKRYMEWDGDPNQVPTKDKKFIYVDTYARWQISNPLQFFKRLRDERSAHSRLDDILDGATRNYIAKNNFIEVIRSNNRVPVSDESLEGLKDSLEQIFVGREEIQNEIIKSANIESEKLGITILDFRFKRLNYKKEVQKQVYERMRSERYRIADKFRSEGQGEASRINGEKERELKKIQSEAFKQAEEIKGKADAEAALIYANSYDKSRQSRELYAFIKSMETFEKTLNGKTSVILSTDSELYKYLKGY